NLIMNPVNYTTLAAMNIPSGVTLTNQGFAATDSIALSTATPAIISGLVEFTRADGTATINSNSTINVSGNLRSAGGLSLIAPQLINSGLVQASGTATGFRDLNIKLVAFNNSSTVSSGSGSVFLTTSGTSLTILAVGTIVV